MLEEESERIEMYKKQKPPKMPEKTTKMPEQHRDTDTMHRSDSTVSLSYSESDPEDTFPDLISK